MADSQQPLWIITVAVKYCPVPTSEAKLRDLFVPLAAQSSQQTHVDKQSGKQPHYHLHFSEGWSSLGKKRGFQSIYLGVVLH